MKKHIHLFSNTNEFIFPDNKTASATLFVPKMAKVVDGSCGNDSQFISLSWDSNVPNMPNTLELAFSKVVNKSDFALSAVIINLTLDDAKGLN
jgi:hypothetical protein